MLTIYKHSREGRANTAVSLRFFLQLIMSNDRHGIALSILQIIPSIMRLLAAELRQADTPLLPPQLGALTLLAETSYNLSELAELHGVSLPTMSNTISKLVEAGWVERHRSEADRRVVMLNLTPAGQQLVENIGQQLVNNVAEQLSDIPNNSLETLQDGLAILQTVFTPFMFKKEEK
jgi:DNA-binding MarR family transcriptional regulator